MQALDCALGPWNGSLQHHSGPQGGSRGAKIPVLWLERPPTGSSTVTESSNLFISAHSHSTLKGSGRNDLGGTQLHQQWFLVQKGAFWPQNKVFGYCWWNWEVASDRPLGMLPLVVRVDIASLGLCAGAREWVLAAPQWASGPLARKSQCWGWNGSPRDMTQ